MDPETEQRIERAREHYERREYAATLTELREVLARHPDFADLRHLAGLCLNFLGQPEQALEEFDRALAVNEYYIEAQLNRALTLADLGRYEEAGEAFERAREAETEQEGGGPFPAAASAKLANAHMDVGDLYMEAVAPEKAAEQYRAAIELRPRFLDIRNKLAAALMRLDDLDGAERELSTVVERNPHFLDARLNLGLVYHRRGEPERAAEQWRECRSQQPNHPQVRAYLALVEGAEDE